MNYSPIFFIIFSAIALAQVVFLPGWLATHFLKVNESVLRRLVMSFGLSLMINYLGVFALTTAHLFTFGMVSALVLLELIVLLYIHRRTLRMYTSETLEQAGLKWVENIRKSFQRIVVWLENELKPEPTSYLKVLILVAAIGTFGYLVYLFIDNLGTVFKLSDAVASWNRWAVEWSTNTLPRNTWEYPQLLPTNWSLVYVLVGVPLEYLSKLIMPLFPLAIALTFWVTALKKKSWAFMAAIPATILLMRLMVGSELMATEGYVDTAVAFFSTVSILSLFWIEDSIAVPKTDILRNLFIGALFALGAAMTKQAGLFIVLVYPILAWIILIRPRPEIRKSFWKYLLIYVGLIIILVGPFYIYKELSISNAGDISVVPTIHELIYGGGKTPLAVASYALYFLIGKTDGLMIIFALLLIVALTDRRYRPIGIGVTILYTLVWSLFNSYDTRNLTLALPFWGLAAGVGIEKIFLSQKNVFSTFISKIKWVYVAGSIILALIAVSPWVSGKIFNQYTQDKRLMIDSEFSALMNNYFDNSPDQKKILTNFGLLYFFPQFKDRIYSLYGGFTPNKNDFDQYARDSHDPAVGYILAASYSDKSTLADLESNIAAGRYDLIFRHRGMILVRTHNK